MADMALLPALSTRSGAELARIGLAEYFDDELFRPSLADELKVGFFSLDRACQTTQSDVIDLKDMTVVLKTLLHDVADMKRDIHLAKEKVKTDYDTKIQYRALDLCKRVSDQMVEIEEMHKERVMVVRRAFRQQFADALARIGSLFKARFEQSMEKEKLQLKQEIQRLRGQMQQMTLTIQKNESVIIMLKNQLASKPAPSEHTLGVLTRPLRSRSSSPSSSGNALHLPGAGTDREPSVDPAKLAQLTKEIENLKGVVQSKEKMIGSMEDELEERQRHYDELSEQYSKLQTDFEKQEAARLQLVQELQDSREEASKQASAAKKLAAMAGELEQQRLELEREAEEKIRKAREEAAGAGTERLREVQAEFGARIRQLMKDNEDLEKQLIRDLDGIIAGHGVAKRLNRKEGKTIGRPRSAARSNLASLLGDLTRNRSDSGRRDRAAAHAFANGGAIADEGAAARERTVATVFAAATASAAAAAPERSRWQAALIYNALANSSITCHQEERAKNLATPPKKVEEELTDTQKLIKSEAMWRQLVEKYKKEIERNNAAWEKKFLVMQASLHALKDESYLRHTLEKQHAALHHATISYTAEGPMTVSAAPARRSVLPSIASNRAASPDPLASFVVSVAPSRMSQQQAPESAAAGDGSEAFTPQMQTVLASASSARSAIADRREQEKPSRSSSKRQSLSAVNATPVIIKTQ